MNRSQRPSNPRGAAEATSYRPTAVAPPEAARCSTTRSPIGLWGASLCPPPSHGGGTARLGRVDGLSPSAARAARLPAIYQGRAALLRVAVRAAYGPETADQRTSSRTDPRESGTSRAPQLGASSSTSCRAFPVSPDRPRPRRRVGLVLCPKSVRTCRTAVNTRGNVPKTGGSGVLAGVGPAGGCKRSEPGAGAAPASPRGSPGW